LDFLGFSRPNRDFSMSYTDKSAKYFRTPFPASGAREPLAETLRMGRIVHQLSLA
jgi:hypothetical protein